MKVYSVVSTKGGSGKTNTANNILPAMLGKCKILEIDNNNESSSFYKESEFVIEHKSISTKEAEEHLQDIVFDLMSGADSDIVIDAGGGDDTLEVVETLKSLNINTYAENIFVIPTMNSLLQAHNVEQMIEVLKGEKIVIALNGVHDLENAEREWVFWYGSEELNIEGFVTKIPKSIKTIQIPHTYLYELANSYNFLLADFAAVAYRATQEEASKEIFKNCNGDREEFKKMLTLFRRRVDAKNLIESIKPDIQKALGVGA